MYNAIIKNLIEQLDKIGHSEINIPPQVKTFTWVYIIKKIPE